MPRFTGTTMLAALLLAAPGQAFADPPSVTITLRESGSTLIEPLFKSLAAAYGKDHSGVALSTAGTGSGQGTAQALSGAESRRYRRHDQARRALP